MFSKLDMTKAYHHIPINPSDRHKTTVLTPWGAYQFKMMAMGLSNASQSFQRYISFILKDIPNLFIYLDDVLLHAKDKQEHDKILKQVLKRLDDAGLTLAVDKCRFGVESLEFLGFNVDPEFSDVVDGLVKTSPPLAVTGVEAPRGGRRG